MAVTVVGTASVNDPPSGSPQSASIPLPGGTMVGDLICVGFWGGFGTTVTDSRLSTSRWSLVDWDGGAQGVATDLSDVTLTVEASYELQALVVVLRGVVGTVTAAAFHPATFDDEVIGSGFLANDWCLAFVDDANIPTTVPADAAADWSTVDSVPWSGGSGVQAIKAYSWLSGAPVPELLVDATDGPSRGVYYVTSAGTVTPRRSWVRQLQGPKTSLRVGGGHDSIRQYPRDI